MGVIPHQAPRGNGKRRGGQMPVIACTGMSVHGAKGYVVLAKCSSESWVLWGHVAGSGVVLGGAPVEE